MPNDLDVGLFSSTSTDFGPFLVKIGASLTSETDTETIVLSASAASATFTQTVYLFLAS